MRALRHNRRPRSWNIIGAQAKQIVRVVHVLQMHQPRVACGRIAGTSTFHTVISIAQPTWQDAAGRKRLERCEHMLSPLLSLLGLLRGSCDIDRLEEQWRESLAKGGALGRDPCH